MKEKKDHVRSVDWDEQLTDEDIHNWRKWRSSISEANCLILIIISHLSVNNKGAVIKTMHKQNRSMELL
jgi:hypothetical protein